MQRIGEKLRTLRKKQGMTLKDLAQELEFSSHTYLVAIEQGKKQPSLELVYKIGKIFEVSYDQLLNDELEVE
jgi:transcriptional regulator with XRE-family HTH domain